MKLLAFFLNIMLCALFAPVTPRVAMALVVSDVAPQTNQVVVSVVATTDTAPPLIVAQPIVCGVRTDTVGEWLSQSVCASVALEVTQADTTGIQLAVTDMPLVAQLAVQRAPATVQTAQVQAGSIPSKTAVDSPAPVVVRSPRTFALMERTGHLSVADQGPVGADAPVRYSLRC